MLSRLGWDNRIWRAVATYGESARGDGYLVPVIPTNRRHTILLRPLQGLGEAEREQRATLTVLLLGRRQGIVGAPHLLLHRAQQR